MGSNFDGKSNILDLQLPYNPLVWVLLQPQTLFRIMFHTMSNLSMSDIFPVFFIYIFITNPLLDFICISIITTTIIILIIVFFPRLIFIISFFSNPSIS